MESSGRVAQILAWFWLAFLEKGELFAFKVGAVASDQAPVVEVDGQAHKNKAQVIRSLAMSSCRDGIDRFPSFAPLGVIFRPLLLQEQIPKHGAAFAIDTFGRRNAIRFGRHFVIHSLLVIGLCEDERPQTHRYKTGSPDEDENDSNQREQVEVDRSDQVYSGKM